VIPEDIMGYSKVKKGTNHCCKTGKANPLPYFNPREKQRRQNTTKNESNPGPATSSKNNGI
jgi:hypothetical protein